MNTHRRPIGKPLPQRSKTLVRALPKAGLCSRTQAFGLIRSGRVTVNGKAISDPNRKVLSGDRIRIDGAVSMPKPKRYILFNKPAGCVTTREDERLRQTVYDILGDVGGWVFPVGRLDKESEGLLLFTNDTAFGDFLTDPANRIERTYAVTVAGTITDEALGRCTEGAGIDIGRGERSRPISVRVTGRTGAGTALEITLIEGKNREIRRLCKALGAPVERLVRTGYGPFGLEGLAPGKWRELDADRCAIVYRQR